MAFKQFLQNLFERLGLAEPPAPPPQAADVPLADPQQLRPIFPRLAVWGVKQSRLIAGDEPEAGDLVAAVRQAVQLGMHVGVRGRASDLASDKLLSDLAAAGVREIEIPFLSAIGEVPRRLGRRRRLSQCAAGDGRVGKPQAAVGRPDRLGAVHVENDRRGPCNCLTIAACVKSASSPLPAATTSRRVGPSRPASWLPPPAGSSNRAESTSTSPGIRR